MQMEKKRHHHYIWRYYLRSWATDGKIACLMEGKIFESNLMGIGQKRDFYKLNELNSNDLSFIKRLAIDSSPKHLQNSHLNLVKQFNLVFRLRDELKSKGVDEPKLNKLLDVTIHNLEENLHADIENKAIKYINSILREDIEFYNTDIGYTEFIYFLCVQLMRTEKIRKSTVKGVGPIEGIDFEKIWNVLSHIFAKNMGWNFYANRELHKMTLLKNETTKELITADQPVINTYATIGASTAPIENVELYYPVSPRIAILVSEKEGYKGISKKLLSENDVVSYNNQIVKNSHKQVYGTSLSVLEEYNR